MDVEVNATDVIDYLIKRIADLERTIAMLQAVNAQLRDKQEEKPDEDNV